MKNKLRPLYQVYSQVLYGFIFIDEQGKYVHFIHENDGEFKSEYMNELLKYFGGKMVVLDVDDSSAKAEEPELWVKEMSSKISSILKKVKK